jgi:molybdopterin-binding protein
MTSCIGCGTGLPTFCRLGGHEVVAAITAESARGLGLEPGKRVVAIIKSTEVMLAVDD